MLSEGNKNKYLSQLLRYSLWAVGLFGVFGIANLLWFVTKRIQQSSSAVVALRLGVR